MYFLKHPFSASAKLKTQPKIKCKVCGDIRMGYTGRCKDGEVGRDIECPEERHVSCWKKVEGNSNICSWRGPESYFEICILVKNLVTL